MTTMQEIADSAPFDPAQYARDIAAAATSVTEDTYADYAEWREAVESAAQLSYYTAHPDVAFQVVRHSTNGDAMQEEIGYDDGVSIVSLVTQAAYYAICADIYDALGDSDWARYVAAHPDEYAEDAEED